MNPFKNHEQSAELSAMNSPAARFWLIVALVMFGAVMRLVPHPWNLAPVGAIALFAGAHFTKSVWAFVVPIAAMLLSDLWLGLHSSMVFVYISYGVIVCLGLLIRSRRRPAPILLASLSGAVFFFLITNFGAWVCSPSTGPHGYEKSFAGLMACYVAGEPFFRLTLIGDLVYTALLFGAFALAERRLPLFAPWGTSRSGPLTTSFDRAMKALLCSSGGKDSALALRAARSAGHEVVGQLTTLTARFDRVSMHGLRRSLLEKQAASLGLPLQKVWLGAPPGDGSATEETWQDSEALPILISNDDYDRAMRTALNEARANDVQAVIFGDIFLEDVRAYREARLAETQLPGLFPLWGRDTTDLAREFIGAGFLAVVVCVDAAKLDESWLGRALDETFLRDLPEGVDPCGERGEFHTFVYDGPTFAEQVPFEMRATRPSPGILVPRTLGSLNVAKVGSVKHPCIGAAKISPPYRGGLFVGRLFVAHRRDARGDALLFERGENVLHAEFRASREAGANHSALQVNGGMFCVDAFDLCQGLERFGGRSLFDRGKKLQRNARLRLLAMRRVRVVDGLGHRAQVGLMAEIAQHDDVAVAAVRRDTRMLVDARRHQGARQHRRATRAVGAFDVEPHLLGRLLLGFGGRVVSASGHGGQHTGGGYRQNQLGPTLRHGYNLPACEFSARSTVEASGL